ncbi:MAG: membrane protein insertase YidC [Endomicrobium sp.]|jgi:YidC/Oxa1 family membrane protein insertase|nr:membrane protein insertase YidC [Endomicrobium sp.]
MQKNSILFVVLSSAVIFIWYFFLTPQSAQVNQTSTQVQTGNSEYPSSSAVRNNQIQDEVSQFVDEDEEKINIETEKYKAVLTNRGAAVLNWAIKEKNGKWVDLVFPGSFSVMGNFPGSVYKIVSKSDNKIVFEYVSKEGWKITKVYNLSDSYMHNLNIFIDRNSSVSVPEIDIKWGPGLGTDAKEMKENVSLSRSLACTADKPYKLKKLKTDSELASSYKWMAIDNRYFLAAFIPEKSSDFDKIIPSRLDKKHPYSVTMTATVPQNVNRKEYSINFYLGPKGYTYLKSYNLGLEKTVDFGVFGFLGKIVFAVLMFFCKITHNYGWAIIMITVIIQILVLPLTLKSLKSAVAMKRVQPFIKDIQTKYKNEPQRLQAEMLNIYRTKKVNPLGGCLPMLLQLPIFWAFFTMLRNAYELRNESWILWVKDLSASDQFMRLGDFSINLLPLLMGVGMFFQQRMTMVASDPMQKRMMYLMPIIFTFMFWSFPSGLVIYWITNSIISMIEQYFIIKEDEIKIKHS